MIGSNREQRKVTGFVAPCKVSDPARSHAGRSPGMLIHTCNADARGLAGWRTLDFYIPRKCSMIATCACRTTTRFAVHVNECLLNSNLYKVHW